MKLNLNITSKGEDTGLIAVAHCHVGRFVCRSDDRGQGSIPLDDCQLG